MVEKGAFVDDLLAAVAAVLPGAQPEPFRAVGEAIESGKHVVVAGLPQSGKTTMLAALLRLRPDAVVISANGAAAKRLTKRVKQ